MTIKQIQHFQSICKYKNITKAAEHLFISQPALTMSLKSLENSLGIQLIKRSKRTISLTKEGEFFLEKSQDFIKHYNRLIEETKDFINERKYIKIGIPLQIGVLMLPIIFNEFKNAFEDVKIEILETGGISTVTRILDEDIQIAVTGISKNYSSDLIIEPLFKAKVCLCVNKNSTLVNVKSIKLEDALKEKLVSLGDTFFLSKILKEEIEKKELKNDVLFTSNQLGTVKTIINSGLASALLIESAIAENDDIIAIPLEEDIYAEIAIVTKKNVQLYKDTKKIKDFFIKKFKNY